MRLVIFSDVHGNGYAMDEFMNILPNIKYDKVIFCGDIFGYYYDQKKIISQLDAIEDLIWIKGNHDENFMNIYRGVLEEKDLIEKYGSSYAGIAGKFDQKYFYKINQLPDKTELLLDHKKIGIFHGTPKDVLNGRLYPDNEIDCGELYDVYDIVILGHTHCRMKRWHHDTLIVNSGSLGQPRDGNTFGFAILDTDTMEVRFQDIYPDCDELYHKIKKNDPKLDKLIDVLERRKIK